METSLGTLCATPTSLASWPGVLMEFFSLGA